VTSCQLWHSLVDMLSLESLLRQPVLLARPAALHKFCPITLEVLLSDLLKWFCLLLPTPS
jgi:hypothetical protein